MIEISEELLAHARSEAAVLGVNAALHEKDYILRFLLENPAFTNQDSALSYYFQDARKSAKQLSRLVSDELGLFGEHGFSMLEFASGYGCVTRHLPAVMSSWQIVSSDIHVEANAFNAENFGVEVLQSTTSPDDFPRHRKFRLVFALSFFSHMPPDTWSRWLRTLWECVDDAGFLAFTTHGIDSRHHFNNPAIPDSGIWYWAASEQGDLSTSDYGQTIVTIPFVMQQIGKYLPEAYPRIIRPGYWWGHQDLYVIGRLPVIQ
ncbi:MAG: hypothetical protein RJA20_867 [Bacteroidota bacterium]|jgi:hypothetical protein